MWKLLWVILQVQNVNSNQVELAEDPVSFAIIYIVQYA